MRRTAAGPLRWAPIVGVLVGLLVLSARLNASPSTAQSPDETLRGDWFQVISNEDGEGRVTFDLYVGQLDAPDEQRPPAFKVLTGVPEWIRGSGPVDATVLAWWLEGETTRVMTFDTSDGASRPITDAEGNHFPAEGRRLL